MSARECGRGENGAFTCGAQGDEGLRVLADHRQLVFGEGQPAHDVLQKVVGDDGRHVPPQLAQHHHLPVLKTDNGDDDRQYICLVWEHLPMTSNKTTGRRLFRHETFPTPPEIDLPR